MLDCFYRKEKIMTRIPPQLLLILATMLWGGNFVIGRAIADDIPPLTLSFLRWTVALLIFFPITWKSLKNEWYLIRKNIGIVIILSITGVAAFNTLVYMALHYTTAINASLMNSSTPIVIYLLSFLFIKERLSKQQIIGAVLSLTGVIFIISDGSLQNITNFTFNSGDLIMLIAVICWSVYSLLVKQFSDRLPGNSTFLVTIIIGIIILFPFFIYEVNQPTLYINWSVTTVLAILYIGIFASIVAFLSWNQGVIKFGASKAGMFLNFIPMFAAIFAVLFIGESLQLSQLFGAVFVISGVYLASK